MAWMTLQRRCLVALLLALISHGIMAADVTVMVTDAGGKPVTDAVVAFYDSKSFKKTKCLTLRSQ
jgi:hypothetical protein